MSCEAVTFEGINSEHFNHVKTALANNGFHITENAGTVKAMGVAMDYEWIENQGTLYVLVAEKPFFLSCKRIYEILEKAINEIKSKNQSV
jgi:hypothetical protein